MYRSDVQKQVFIYHAELGINPNHVDFTGRPVEWVYTRQAKFTGNDIETEASSSEVPGHSTCVASKAAGGIYGSSRLSTLVVVKMPDLRPTSTCEIFSTITDHILENDRLGRSIVTVSWGSKDPIRLDDIDRGGYWSHWRRVRRQIEELDAIGALLLFAAGNEAQETDRMGHLRTEVDTAPAIFAVKSTTHRVLAVSNVDSRGRLWRTSQSLTKPFADRWNVFAPGVQIKCATHDSNSKVRIDTGTSFGRSKTAYALFSISITDFGNSCIFGSWSSCGCNRNQPDSRRVWYASYRRRNDLCSRLETDWWKECHLESCRPNTQPAFEHTYSKPFGSDLECDCGCYVAASLEGA